MRRVVAFHAGFATMKQVRYGIFLGLLTLAGCAHPTTTHQVYPSSPQWRAGHFHNPGEWPNKMNASNALKWRLTPHDHFQPFTPPTQPNDGSQLRANSQRASLTWIGHATVLLQSGGVNVLTDPNFADDTGGLFRRTAPPGVAIQDLPPIDVVVISHNHRDHLDEDSVKKLGPKVQYVVPLGMASWFRARKLTHVTELDWWQSTKVTARNGATVELTLVPAQHWSQRSGVDKDRTLWGGYVIDAGGKRTYFAGDTGYPAAFAEIGKRFPGIDYALLPIGCYAPRWFMHPQHMAPEEAAAAFRELGAKELLPIHWATFRLTDEPMDEPPKLLYEAMGKLVNHILFLPIGGTFWDSPSRPKDSAALSPTASN
jgi:L-ascorbate metabolism protein UlaG (beta-lactamase superfamily)